jgi:hypothetical protein
MHHASRASVHSWSTIFVALAIALLALLAAQRTHAEGVTLSVRGDVAAGALPTWYEPSAFIAFTTDQMKREFFADAVKTRGMFLTTTHFLLAPSTSLSDYQRRLANSGLAQEAGAIAKAGGKVVVTISGMPAWLSSSKETGLPPGCTGEWPTYQTVAPAASKWADWEAVVRATVTYFNVTNKLSNVSYLFWQEPDGPCFWTDTQANYLETWKHFVTGARSADPSARVGGPATAAGLESIKPGWSLPLIQAFIDYSAAQKIQPDFIAYHLFEAPPEAGRVRNRAILSMLQAKGLKPVPIIVSSWNPMHACYEPNFRKDDPSWPFPPSALGCWQPDTEMGASYALALMSHLSHNGVAGYQTMYALDDGDVGASEEFPHEWGARTSRRKNGIRKALYHAQTIVGRMPRSLTSAKITHANRDKQYFDHVFALAGVEADKLSVLVWSYVSSPAQQAAVVLKDMGYGVADLQRMGGMNRIAAYVNDRIPVSDLTGDAKEQADLQRMKVAYHRQRALASQDSWITFDVSGFPSAGAGYQVTRYLIDETHNNAYYTALTSGLSDAIAGQHLQMLDSQTVSSLTQIPTAELKRYAVMLVEIVRKR